jgi:predicted site-specific integrase-resolvase
MAKQLSDLVTELEAARIAGVSRVTIFRWLRDGKLTRVEIAGKPFCLRSEAEALGKGRRVRKRA